MVMGYAFSSREVVSPTKTIIWNKERLMRFSGGSLRPEPLLYVNLAAVKVKVKFKVTLRLTISQSVSLGVEPHLGIMTRYLLLFMALLLWGVLSNERTGLSFVYAAGSCQRSYLATSADITLINSS
jgi:hypothetical protein